MSAFSPKALRMIQAVEKYKNNCKRWDASLILPKINIKSAEGGKITGSFEITEDVCNLAKSVHGGFIASVIDAMSLFGVIHHDKGVLAYTTDMNVVFVGKGYTGDIIDVEAKTIYVSKSRATMDCVLTERKRGGIIAKAVVGFIFPDPPVLFMDDFPYNPKIW